MDALAKNWFATFEDDDLDLVKAACRRLIGKLKRFPYPSDVRDELAPTSVASTTVASLSIEIDTSSIDAAMVKVEQLKAEISGGIEPLAAELLVEQRRTNELLSRMCAHGDAIQFARQCELLRPPLS